MKDDRLVERSIPRMFLSLKLQPSRFVKSSSFTWGASLILIYFKEWYFIGHGCSPTIFPSPLIPFVQYIKCTVCADPACIHCFNVSICCKQDTVGLAPFIHPWWVLRWWLFALGAFQFRPPHPCAMPQFHVVRTSGISQSRLHSASRTNPATCNFKLNQVIETQVTSSILVPQKQSYRTEPPVPTILWAAVKLWYYTWANPLMGTSFLF